MRSLMAGNDAIILNGLTLSLSILSIQDLAFFTTDLMQLTFAAAQEASIGW